MTQKLEIHGMDNSTMVEVVRKMHSDIAIPRIGLDYLPFKDVATEEVTWDIVRAASPMADFRAVDGESKIRGKRAFDRGYADVVSISEKERFTTTELRKIREAGKLPTVDGTKSLISQQGADAERKIRDSLSDMKLSIDNRIEWMQINALLGTISYAGRVKFDVDFAIPGNQTGVTPTTAWSDTANSNPLEDIQTWQIQVQDEFGILLDEVIMSRKTLNYISQNENLQNVMQYTIPMLSVEKAKEVIEDNAGIKIRVYDAAYTDIHGDNRTRFLPQNKIIMLPSKEQMPEGLGKTFRTGHPLADYTPGYYTWQEPKSDPYGLEVGVGMDCFPAIQHPEALFNADVWSL